WVRHLPSAVRAVAGSNLILKPTTGAFFGDFATGHGHEEPARAFNDLQITHDEFVVYCDQAKCPQSVFQV
ncbi:MAG: hypothetical protein RIT02_1060, partial [Planctomycetota bacterium]